MTVAMLDEQLERFIGPSQQVDAVLAGALALAGIWPIEGDGARHGAHAASSPWDARDGWQLGGTRRQPVRVIVDGEPLEVDLVWDRIGVTASLSAPASEEPNEDAGRILRPGGADIEVFRDGERLLIIDGLRQTELMPWRHDADLDRSGSSGARVAAPMHGRVSKLYVTSGERVAKGDRLLVLEAMKMEHVLHAQHDGVVDSVACAEGAQVEQGAVLVSVAADEAA